MQGEVGRGGGRCQSGDVVRWMGCYMTHIAKHGELVWWPTMAPGQIRIVPSLNEPLQTTLGESFLENTSAHALKHSLGWEFGNIFM